MITRQRIEWIDVARGASIILVVLYHTNVWLDSYHLISDVYVDIDRAFRPIRMPLFFTISGYLASRAIQKGWRTVLVNKVGLLLYLYGLWSVIQWLLFSSVALNSKHLDVGTDPFQLVSMWYAPATGLWFIWALAIYFFTARLFSGRSKRIALFAATAVSVVFMSRLVEGLNFAQLIALWYLPFFLGGMWYGHIAVERITQDTRKTIAVCLVVFVVTTAVTTLVSSGLVVGLSRLAQSFCGLIAGCAASVVASRVDLIKRVLTYFGRNTLPIFLTHEMIIELFAMIISRHVSGDGLFHYLGSPLVVIATLGTSLALHRLVLLAGPRWLYDLPAWPRPGPVRLASKQPRERHRASS